MIARTLVGKDKAKTVTASNSDITNTDDENKADLSDPAFFSQANPVEPFHMTMRLSRFRQLTSIVLKLKCLQKV